MPKINPREILDGVEYKKCPKCLKYYPCNNEYFYKDKNKKDGLTTICRKCKLEYSEHYRNNNQDIVRQSKHKEYEKHKERYRRSFVRWRENNKEYLKQYLENNKEHRREIKRRWYEENLKHCAEYARKYYSKNKTYYLRKSKEYREANNETIRIKLSLYAKAHPERKRLSEAKRRAQKYKVSFSYSIEAWEECKEYFKKSCAYCGDKNKRLTQDHFIALSKGGEHTKNNIVPACARCNCSKNVKDFFEWYKRQTFYSKQRENRIISYLNIIPKTKYQQLSIS